MFGDKNLIMNNKILAKHTELEERDIDKEYEIELEYDATVSVILHGKEIIKVISKNEEDAIEKAQDILYDKIDTSEGVQDEDLELDTVNTKILNIIPCVDPADTKTIDMFSR